MSEASRSKRIKRLVAIAKHQELESQNSWFNLRQYTEKQKIQLNNLHNFKNEYHSAMSKKGMEGMEASQLQNYYLFLSYLDRSVETQSTLIKQQNLELMKSEQKFLEAKKNTEVLKALVDRLYHQEYIIINRQEQTQIDEVASINRRPKLNGT